MTDGRKLWIGFALALVMAVFAVWMGVQEARMRPGSPAPVQTRTPRPRPSPRSDALRLAELAFAGNHSRQQIKDHMDRAMELYGLPRTEENYNRAASALVALRKENGTPEMAILDYMIRSHVPGVEVSFPNAAAMASIFLMSGDR